MDWWRSCGSSPRRWAVSCREADMEGERRIHMALGADSYPILLGNGMLDRMGEYLQKDYPGARILVVTDQHVNALYGDRVEAELRHHGFTVGRTVLPAGEATKSFSSLPPIYQDLMALGCTRKDLVLALGGGVIGDLAGFAAATYLRGVPYIQVPTSLLAQVDSSIGGKVAVDLPEGKNLVGSFYQPKAVFIDPALLSTLPQRVYADGMGEVIKYGCIGDGELFSLLEQGPHAVEDRMEEVIYRCCRQKQRYVERDPRDRGERMALNFGHTLGHAIEALESYKGLSHGEAVSVGMAAITRLAERKGLTRSGTADRIRKTLMAYDLPADHPLLYEKDVLSAVQRDKKNLGSVLKVVLLKEIGEAYLYDTTPAFFEELSQ
jgi:3-dehydroquinate synthase